MQPQLRIVGSGDPALFSPSYTYDDWVEDLRGIVWNAYAKGRMSLEEIAAKADLGATTVEKFAWGETKRPQGRTLFQLATATGFRLPFIPNDAPRQPNEPDLTELRALIRTRD